MRELSAVPGLERMNLQQLARASVVYGLGFFVLFLMFALLYRHAYNKRDELGLTPLEVVDVKVFAGHHLVSASVGLLSVVFALLAPIELSPIAPSMLRADGSPARALRPLCREKAEVFVAAQR